MKVTFDLKETFKRFCILLFFIFILFIQTDLQNLKAFTMENSQSGSVIEELRLKVPSDFKDAWLKAEKKIWDPWLSNQEGFLGRQLFWDKERQEALILVNWKSKKLWKSISIKEVNEVQAKFEENVKSSLNVDKNPFILIYEGELGQGA